MGRKKKSLEEIAPHVAQQSGDFVEEYCIKPVYGDEGEMVSSGILRNGQELPDPEPLAPPLGYTPPMPLMELMALMIRRQVEPQNDYDITETEEEANDFADDPDEVDLKTPYEKVFDPPDPTAPPAGNAPAASPALPTESKPAAEAGSPAIPPPAAVPQK
jgi:hypothetical protein